MAKKRGNNEGSIYKMSDGRWRAALMVGWKIDKDGRRRPDRLIFTGDTRHEVADALASAIRDRARGINVKPGKLTVGDFLAAWLQNTVRPSVRPKTYRSYEQMVRNHLSKTVPSDEWMKHELDLVPGLKDVPLSKLTLQRVQQFFNQNLTPAILPRL